MSLSVIATPIGNTKDISYRAIEALESADVVIGEEAKVTRRLLSSLKEYFIEAKPIAELHIEELNEHSTKNDIAALFELCKIKNVALVSDCGTPGFCDPGAELINLCRKENVEVKTLPGASSLMSFLSGSGIRWNSFHFEGFIPANTEERNQRLKVLAKSHNKTPIIIMDTPYRLTKTIEDCAKHFANRELCLGTELTKESEVYYYGKAAKILSKIQGKKLEFVLAILA